jgi:hypothetical protein
MKPVGSGSCMVYGNDRPIGGLKVLNCVGESYIILWVLNGTQSRSAKVKKKKNGWVIMERYY